MWEDNIIWDGSSSDEGDDEREEKDSGDEEEEDAAPMLLDPVVPHDAGGNGMMDMLFGGGGDDMVLAPGGRGGDDGVEIIAPDDDKKHGPGNGKKHVSLTIVERIALSKRYFAERDVHNPTNEVVINQRNVKLEDGAWLDHILWQDSDRKRVAQTGGSLPRRFGGGGRRVGGSSLARQTPLAPHSRAERVHDCVPPWWSRPCEHKQLSLESLAMRLDLSNDHYYQGGAGSKARIRLGRPSVMHAPAATRFPRRAIHTDGLRSDFHRPRMFIDARQRFHIAFSPVELPEKSKDRKALRGAQEKIMAMKKPRDVTCADSRNLIIEHLEECPPMVSNPGMAARIRHFYRSKHDAPPPTIPQEHLNDGKPVALDPQQDSPFFGELPDGANAFVSALENNMQRSPMVKHQAESSDFLVVKCGDKYYLREIDSMYLAGQTYPFVKVPAPESKDQKAYERKQLQTFILSRLRHGGTIQMHEIFDEFKAVSETSIRRELGVCGNFVRKGGDGGHWTLKDANELPKDLVETEDSAETVCVQESLQNGHMRLQNMGISKLHQVEVQLISQVDGMQKDRNLDKGVQAGALCVHEAVRFAPWNMTNNLVTAADRAPLTLSTLSGSETSKKLSRSNEQNFSKHDPKDKKVQADIARKRQMIFNEQLEMISSKEPPTSSSDEEGRDGEDPEDQFEGRSAKPRRVERVTLAHRWRKEEMPTTGEFRWKCETVTNPTEVGRMHKEQEAKKTPLAEDGLDERTKHHARKEKKRLQEQKRRQDMKRQKQLNGSHSASWGGGGGPRREKAGVIKLSKEQLLDYEQKKKNDARKGPDGAGRSRRAGQRRRLDPLMDLRNVFSRAVNAMWQDPKSVPFRAAVDAKKNPDYKRIIKKPVDLNIIRTRIGEACYRSRHDFLEDVNLMASNCKLYCQSRDTALVSTVYELVQVCKEQLKDESSTVKEAEAMQHDAAGATKRACPLRSGGCLWPDERERALGSAVKLSGTLESVALDLHNRHDHFRKAPNDKAYQAVVKQPMDIATIQHKAQDFSYCSREALLNDVQLIRDNCVLFCSLNFPNLPPLAEKLLVDAHDTVKGFETELNQLEQSIGQWKVLAMSAKGTPGTSVPGTPFQEGSNYGGSQRGGGDEEEADADAMEAEALDGMDDAPEEDDAAALEDALDDKEDEEMEENDEGEDENLADGMSINMMHDE
ncbi:hypothetical protein T484DRAFT_1883814 [Baffinella frigidus]|nr:hypothetical protein T484DRAFT_1883814 [Cryptophyta sp. CCMP2293]